MWHAIADTVNRWCVKICCESGQPCTLAAEDAWLHAIPARQEQSQYQKTLVLTLCPQLCFSVKLDSIGFGILDRECQQL